MGTVLSSSAPSPLEVRPSDSPAYRVFVERGFERLREERLFESLGVSRLFVLSQEGLDDAVIAPFLKATADLFDGPPEDRVLQIRQGEAAKHINNLAPVYNRLIEADADRKSCLVALGGGVVGDFTGFVAATLLRGVAYVQIPTTLLAAVDSSVGGKTAVNVDRGKNMVGAFYQPRFVYFNTELLRTLPEREWVCGLAEMIKHGCLEASGRILADLEEHAEELRDPGADALRRAVLDSAGFKAEVVRQDEREGGLRAILNLGHTTAHALESLTHYERFSHGEAVSRGLVTALLLSRNTTGLAPDVTERYLKLMERLGMPRDTANFSADDILDHMRFDKKAVRGVPRYVLLAGPGDARFGVEVPADEFRRAWDEQRERFG